MTQDRCTQCALSDCAQTDECPMCGAVSDISVSRTGSLTITCRKCGFAAATTAHNLCFWDNGAFGAECYSKLADCPYAYRQDQQ